MLQSLREIEWKKASSSKQKVSLILFIYTNITQKSERVTKKGKGYPVLIATRIDIAEKWMKSLATTDEPLHKLASAVPHGFKDHSLLKILIREKVPLLRASWYIKVIYLNRIKEQKQDIDPQIHWTDTLVAFLVYLIKEFHPQTTPQSQSQSQPQAWNLPKSFSSYSYTVKLIQYNYQDGLLDGERLFTKLLSVFQDFNRPDELSLFISILYPYLSDIATSYKYIVHQLVTIIIDKLTMISSYSNTSNKLMNEIISSLVNFLKYLVVTSPQSLSTLDNKYLMLLLHYSNPNLSSEEGDSIIGNAIEETEDEESEMYYEQLYPQNQEMIQYLHSKHLDFTQILSPHYNKFNDPIEELDKFSRRSDNTDLYNSLFSTIKTGSISNTSATTSNNELQEVVFAICNWTVTKERSQDPFSMLLSVNLLSKYVKMNIKDIDTSKKPPLQSILIKFLDSFIPSSIIEKYQIIRFYGELIRYGIFSHDYYVRHLISTGVLESSNSALSTATPISSSPYLTEFPLFEETSSYQHELNQRRAAILTHFKDINIINTENETLIVLKKSIQNMISACMKIGIESTTIDLTYIYQQLRNSSRYIQLNCSHWLLSTVKRHLLSQFPPNSSPLIFASSPSQSSPINPVNVSNLEQVSLVIKLLEQCVDYSSLCDLLLWLLKQNFPDQGFYIVAQIRKYEYAFVCIDLIIDIITILFDRCKEYSSVDIYFYYEYLIELIDRYRDIKSISQWNTKYYQQVKDLTRNSSLVTKNESSVITEFVNLFAFMNGAGIVNPNLAAILEQQNLTKKSVTEAIKTIFECGISYCLSDQNDNITLKSHISSLVNIFQHLCSLNSYLHKVLMNVLREDIIANLTLESLDTPKYNFILHLIVTLSITNQVIQLPQLLSHVILPLIPKALKKLQEDKNLNNFPYLCLHFIRIILGDTTTTISSSSTTATHLNFEEEEKEELSKASLLLNKKQQYSLVTLMLTCYYNFSTNKHWQNETKQYELIMSIILDIFKSPNFRVFANSMICSGDFTDQFNKFNDSKIQWNILHSIFGTLTPITESISTSVSTISSKYIQNILNNANLWNLKLTNIELKLVVETMYAAKEDLEDLTTKKLINLFMYYILNNPHNLNLWRIFYLLNQSCSSHQILSLFFTEMDDILRYPDLISGSTLLKDYLANFVNSQLSQNIVENENIQNLTANNNDIENAIITMVTSLLRLDEISQDIKKNFVVSIYEQLEIIINSITMTSIALNSNTTTTTTAVAMETEPKTTLENCILFRIKMIIPLIPFIKQQKKLCKYEELSKTILTLLCSTIVQQSQELFNLLLTVLDTLLNDPQSYSNALTTLSQEDSAAANLNNLRSAQLKAFYEKLQSVLQESDMPAKYKAKVEQILPATTSTSQVYTAVASLVKGKRPVELWSLLEDYADAPLSPSMFGAEKMERKELTYSEEMFRQKRIKR